MRDGTTGTSAGAPVTHAERRPRRRDRGTRSVHRPCATSASGRRPDPLERRRPGRRAGRVRRPSSAPTASASRRCQGRCSACCPLAAGHGHACWAAQPGQRPTADRLPAAAAQLRPGLRIRGVDVVRLGLDGDRWGVPLPARPARRRRRRARQRVDEVIELVGATAYAHRPIGQLSGGEQQRLLIAQALVRRPAAAAARRAARQPRPAQPGGGRRADRPDLPRARASPC